MKDLRPCDVPVRFIGPGVKGLTREEAKNVLVALAYLKDQIGTWTALGKMLGIGHESVIITRALLARMHFQNRIPVGNTGQRLVLRMAYCAQVDQKKIKNGSWPKLKKKEKYGPDPEWQYQAVAHGVYTTFEIG